VARHPLEIFDEMDPELRAAVEDLRTLALSDGAIPKKYKFLIAVALDAAHGATNGVGSLAGQAIKAGATKEEIAEALRVALFISGVGSTYTAGPALAALFGNAD
jgi:alkylhydroperoxidase/carboxymuconolactone decarboxylase family protein YurZ